MKRSLSSRHWGLLGACATLIACEPDVPDVDPSCSDTTQCAPGYVCHAPTQTCVEEPSNGFVGTFSCVVVEGSGFAPLSSDLIGAIGTRRWSLPFGALCTREPVLETLELMFLENLENDDTLSIALDWAAAEKGGRITLVGPDRFREANTATLWDAEDDTTYGHSAEGTVTLDNPAEVGEELSGFVDLRMHPVAREGFGLGLPCPNGVADCGSALAQYCYKYEVDGEPRAQCSRPCESTMDCLRYGDYVCIDEGCTTPCGSDADCSAGLVCATDSIGLDTGCL